MHSSPTLYDRFAHLWPLLSPPASYEAEAAVLTDILERTLPPIAGEARRSVLELGGGGGHTLHHLADAFNVAALDVCEPMLAQCRRRDTRVRMHLGDMRTARLGETFDAVLAHDAIDYMTTPADVRAACATAAAHLRPGGLFLVGPTYTTETFTDFEHAHDAHGEGTTEVACVSYVHRTGANGSTYELVMVLLIREDGALSIEEARHACGLFPMQQWWELLDKTGFDVQDAPGVSEGDLPHDLFVAVKR